jgi:hypothetical protein
MWRPTPQEVELTNDLAMLWNKYCALPVEHGSDGREFEHHMHVLMRMVLARSGRRFLNRCKHCDGAKFVVANNLNDVAPCPWCNQQESTK